MRLHHQPSPPWLATSLLLAAHLILASGHQLRASTVHLPDPAAFGARAAAAQAAAAAAAGGGPHGQSGPPLLLSLAGRWRTRICPEAWPSLPAPAAGTFSDPLPLQPPPSTTPWLSMADGHFKLSAAAANLCR